MRGHATAACLALLAARAFGRITAPGLWAEDGRIFLSEALQYGVGAWWRPYAGYLHTVPRWLAWFGLQLPLSWFAGFVAVASIALAAWVFSRIADPRYRHLIADDQARLGVSMALCFTPGLPEILGNLTNLHWLTTLYLALVAAQDPRRRLHGVEIVSVALAALSDGAAFCLLPAFLMRVWRRQGREWLAAAAIVGPTCVNFAAWWSQRHEVQPVSAEASLPLPASVVLFLGERLAVLPWLGGRELNVWMQRPLWAYVLLCLVLFSVLVTLLPTRRSAWPAYGAALGLCATAYLTWFVRPGSVALFVHSAHDITPWRYAFIATPMAVVLWGSALSQISRRLAFIFVAVFVGTSLYRFNVPVYEPRQEWSRLAREVERLRAGGEGGSLPISPPGWTIDILPRLP